MISPSRLSPGEDESEHRPLRPQCRNDLGGTIQIVVHEDDVGRAVGGQCGQQFGNLVAAHDDEDVVIDVPGRQFTDGPDLGDPPLLAEGVLDDDAVGLNLGEPLAARQHSDIHAALEQAGGADRAVHPGADREDSGVITCHNVPANNRSKLRFSF